MGTIRIPIDAVDSFSAELSDFISELEQQRTNVSAALNNLYASWSGTAKNAFQGSAAAKIGQFDKLIDSFHSAQNVFTATVLPGLHSLQRTAARLGDAFGAGSDSDGGTLTLGESGDALSCMNQTIQEFSEQATAYLDKALASISEVSSAKVSAKGIGAIKTAAEKNAESFQSITTGFSSYQISVHYYCRGLHQSFGSFKISDETRQTILNMDSSTLGPAGQLTWISCVYNFCMEDDSVWKQMLSKDAADITPAEYVVLTRVYSTLDVDKLQDFLAGCMDSYYTEESRRKTPYADIHWHCNQEKITVIADCLALIYGKSLDDWRGMDETNGAYASHEAYLKQTLQRLSILNAMGSITAISSKVVKDENGEIAVPYLKLWTPESRPNTYVLELNGRGEAFYELYYFKEVKNGDDVQHVANKCAEVATSAYLDPASSIILNNAAGTVVDDALGAIPYAGPAIVFAKNLIQDLIQGEEVRSFANAQLGTIKAGTLYEDFDCFVVPVERTYIPAVIEFSDQQVSESMFMGPGRETENLINEFNKEHPDFAFSFADLQNNPVEVYKKIDIALGI